LAKPNYNFAKRQRELAKKAKKEEKLLRKAGDPAAPSDPADDTEPADGGETVVDAETPRQP
jgi:hypothetical protein